MNRATILSAVAAVAVLSSGTPVTAKPPAHKPYTVLYSQNSNFGYGVDSQNFSSAMASYDDIAADDFDVPSGQTWYVSEVDVTGAYADGSGPASSVVVTLWSGLSGPKRIVHRGADSFTLGCTDNAGSFQCVLPTDKRGRPVVKLKAGRYWLTVVANCDYDTCGEWKWTENTFGQGFVSIWKNPGNGFNTSCVNWTAISECLGSPYSGDLTFTLIGTP